MSPRATVAATQPRAHGRAGPIRHGRVDSGQRSYGGQSAAQRKAERREVLVSAGYELIGTAGFASLTVGRLCNRASLNERYYYENFNTLDEVLGAVFEQASVRIAEAVHAGVDAAGVRSTMPERAAAAIGAVVDLLAAEPQTLRIAFAESAAHPLITGRSSEILDMFTTLVLAGGHVPVEQSGRSIPAFTARFLLGGLFATVTAWRAGELEITRDELIAEAGRVFVAASSTTHDSGPETEESQSD